MKSNRFIQEVGRQFRLDRKDDEDRRKREEEPLDVQETAAAKDDNSRKETVINKKPPENGDHVSAGEQLIGQGKKWRTWIRAPLALGLLAEQAEKEEGEDEDEEESVAPEKESQTNN